LITQRNFEPNSYLIKLPLPLGNYVGRILNGDEFLKIKSIIDKLLALKAKKINKDHIYETQAIFWNSILPIEPLYSQSMVLIARNDIKYFYELS